MSPEIGASFLGGEGTVCTHPPSTALHWIIRAAEKLWIWIELLSELLASKPGNIQALRARER